MKNGGVVDLTEESDDDTTKRVVSNTATHKKSESGASQNPLRCECTRDIKCLHCCMRRKEQKDKLLKQKQLQQKQKQQQQQQQQQKQQQQQQPQQQQHSLLPAQSLSPQPNSAAATSTTNPNNHLRIYSSERVVTPEAKFSDAVETKKRPHPDTTASQSTSDIVGTVIDADDEFVYILNGSKVRVVPKASAMSQKNIADAVKRMKHDDDTMLIPTPVNTDVKPVTPKPDPLQALGLISQNSFGGPVEEADIVVNEPVPVDPALQYYSLIPVMPFYYYENQKQQLKAGELKPGKRAKNGKPLLTTLTADLSMVQGPLPRSSLQCHLCKQTYMDIHSLAHHNCSGIGEWRNELNAKWWKNFKA